MFAPLTGILTIQWFKPTDRSKERGRHWEDYNYTEHNNEIKLGRNRGVNRVRLEPKVQSRTILKLDRSVVKLYCQGEISLLVDGFNLSKFAAFLLPCYVQHEILIIKICNL